MNRVLELHRHRAARPMAVVRPIETFVRLPRSIRFTSDADASWLESQRLAAGSWLFRNWRALCARLDTLDTLLDLRRPDHPVAYVLTAMAGEASRHERWQQLLAVHSMSIEELQRMVADPDAPESMVRRCAREIERRTTIARAHR